MVLKNKKKLIFMTITILCLIGLTIITIEESIKPKTEKIPCYDRHGNIIIGLECLDQNNEIPIGALIILMIGLASIVLWFAEQIKENIGWECEGTSIFGFGGRK